MKLKTIEDHNEEVLYKYLIKNLTGVECPRCKQELQFSTRGIILSYPAKSDVECFGCGYTTQIYVH